jgi:hypothetical protein
LGSYDPAEPDDPNSLSLNPNDHKNWERATGNWQLVYCF